MTPLSPEFAYFMAILLPLYWLLPRVARIQNAVILAASALVFYSWSPGLLWVLAASVLADFFIAQAIDRARALPGAGDGATQQAQRRMRALVGLSIAVNLGELLWFKYEGFFANSINVLLGAVGAGALVPVLALAVPIGLSFRALQKLGYIIDVYHGRVAASRDLLSYAAWVTFFPQLLAGPITRAPALLPHFGTARRPVASQWGSGAATFLLGFALKAFVAERLTHHLVDPVFAQAGHFDAVSHWAALVGYAGEVFCDFGGYSLMAIGIGRLLGLELPANFNYPFLSRSLPEFWRRWHITLNSWLFDYIFVPLTTGRGWFRSSFAPAFLLVFGLSGLWHGARWTFVLWGLLQGVGLCVHFWWDEWYKRQCRRDRRWVQWRRAPAYGAAAWFLTQAFFVVTLIPFRAPDMSQAVLFAQGLMGSGTERYPVANLQVLLCAAFLLAYHLAPLRPGGWLVARFLAMPAPVRGIAYGLAVLLILVLAPVGGATFIYAQF